MFDKIKREPILQVGVGVGAVAVLIQAILLLLKEFNVPLTEGQESAIVGVWSALSPFVVWIVARWFTVPKSEVREV